VSIYVAPRPLPAKAGPLGPGAGPLNTEPLLSSILGQSPQKRMRKAWQLGISVPWIRRAEMVISDLCSTTDWHLEDALDVEIDDETTDQDARRIKALIEKPYANTVIGKKYTRRDLWALTFRHMGLCGNAFWYLDGVDGLGIPSNTLYIRPDRMTPREDGHGNLVGWTIDARQDGSGTRVELNQVIQFMLQPPDEGHFGVGLVESALLKIDIATGTDRHAISVLGAGGRLQGIMSPKAGVIEDTAYRQLQNDARTIVEQPDAAKRLQIVRAPVDFTSTAMTMDEAKVVEMMVRARDDLFTLWGTPLAAIGGPAPVGLNSGSSRKEDDAVLWQKANHPRIVTFTEAIQYQLLDEIPVAPLEFEIEEPEFDDDAPRYDLLAKSISTPMKNKERRALIGLDPFGDARDDEVWLPLTQQLAFVAPGEVGAMLSAPVTAAAPRVPDDSADRAASVAGETGQGKATIAGLHASLTRLRATVERTTTPKLRSDVAKVLSDQRAEVAGWIRAHNDHVASNPKDRAWWNAGSQDRRLRTALAAPVIVMAQQISEHIGKVVPPAKASAMDAAQRALVRGAARVTNINQATQDAIAVFISDGVEAGMSPAELADAIETGVTLANGVPAFDEYRAELIARTELMDAYNGAALASYGDAGLTQVQAIDGDQDEECASRDGRTFGITEADGIEDHPNGTLDWVPVIGGI
jgi:phage portal protein BeeE